MSFFKRFVKPYQKGERNFDRARDSESRRNFDKAAEYYKECAAGFDEHLAEKRAAGKDIRPSHLAMAGVSYTRLGRYEDALSTLDECLELKDIPDAFLYAGFAAVRLGQLDRAAEYWKNYPTWADQRILANMLKEQLRALKADDPDTDAICEAVIRAVTEQSQYNRVHKHRMAENDKHSVYRQWY